MPFQPAQTRPTQAPHGGMGARAASVRNNRNNNVSLPQAGD